MIYHFGDFALDTDSLELSQGGAPVDVEPQVFSLLACLIENRARVVSKDELIEMVWDGRIVSYGTLNTRINSVRRAVGDDGKRQAVIKTFPRRGFRFVAEVTEKKESDLQPVQSALPTGKPSIAVLPFTNMSADPEQEYFCDGIAEEITGELSIPTIGIGAGPGCDGQVLVNQDMLGLGNGFNPKFLKRYADLRSTVLEAVSHYAEDVRTGAFPGQEHSHE